MRQHATAGDTVEQVATVDPDAPVTTPSMPMNGRPAREYTVAERRMRRLLRVTDVDKKASLSAHRAFRISVVISGIRCLATYLVIPLLVPLISFAGVLAAPVGIALVLVAYVSGVLGVRRFWKADHRSKWTYTWFMAVVFTVLTIALVADVVRLIQT
ncbi:MAG: hypothetical protein Q4G46_08205 [Propionibacteriaceae bacterium]|nr:hypothetical protein [Propionibacteriaceae bacterium]